MKKSQNSSKKYLDFRQKPQKNNAFRKVSKYWKFCRWVALKYRKFQSQLSQVKFTKFVIRSRGNVKSKSVLVLRDITRHIFLKNSGHECSACYFFSKNLWNKIAIFLPAAEPAAICYKTVIFFPRSLTKTHEFCDHLRNLWFFPPSFSVIRCLPRSFAKIHDVFSDFLPKFAICSTIIC